MSILSQLTAAEKPYDKLSKRVQQQITDRENRAEVLTRILQLLIVLFFCGLYLSSPKLGDPEKQYITPTILGLFVVLNGIGYVWAKRSALPDWAVYGSILIDFTLLYSLIWAYHIIYNQPPSFYLKAPTLLYVFIFIALRALRFQARFVLAAGLTAALGWCAMFGYVIAFDKFNEMLTRDFVVYITSNSILVGAEIDKIISILVVTAILALSIERARNTMVQAIAEQDAATSLSRFFDKQIANEITGSDTHLDIGQGAMREAAILNVDVRSFSRFAREQDPHIVMNTLHAYHKRVVPIIQAHNGSIDKFLGDGILASFGAVQNCGDCCAKAMRTIDAIIADFQTWQDDPVLSLVAKQGIGLSLSYGSVIFGPVGDGDRLEFTVIGSSVNVSAKLEKYNKILGSTAIIAKEAYDLAVSQGYKPQRHHQKTEIEPEEFIDKMKVVYF